MSGENEKPTTKPPGNADPSFETADFTSARRCLLRRHPRPSPVTRPSSWWNARSFPRTFQATMVKRMGVSQPPPAF